MVTSKTIFGKPSTDKKVVDVKNVHIDGTTIVDENNEDVIGKIADELRDFGDFSFRISVVIGGEE